MRRRRPQRRCQTEACLGSVVVVSPFIGILSSRGIYKGNKRPRTTLIENTIIFLNTFIIAWGTLKRGDNNVPSLCQRCFAGGDDVLATEDLEEPVANENLPFIKGPVEVPSVSLG